MKFKLNSLLKTKNKSVYWLKDKTGISHATIYNMANNKTKMISFENLEKLCIALECTPNDLFELEPIK